MLNNSSKPGSENALPNWVTRQEEGFRAFEAALEKSLSREIIQIKTLPLDELLDQARGQRDYDAYHSTRIEGYLITEEEVKSLLVDAATVLNIPGESEESRRNRFAILGYGQAFDFVSRRAEADFGNQEVSEEMIKDAYFHLFKPSVDTGVIDRESVVKYRNIAAYIRGSGHTPPSWEKLVDLMPSFVSSVNKVKCPIIKAILAHYFFVAIHPYIDGNGRTARLIMNYFLLTAGYPWLTIRFDQRAEYFTALNKGTVDSDILAFGEFIVGKLRVAR